MRKHVYTICEQERRRSACAAPQSDQRLCGSLPRQYYSSNFYIGNFKSLASFCGCAGRFESYLVENHEDRFSRDEAQLYEHFLDCTSMLIIFFNVTAIFEPHHDKINKMTCTPSEDSGQPGH